VQATYALGETSVVNFTDSSIYTRQTDWSRLPEHGSIKSQSRRITIEEPCDYVDNNHERYYPVKMSNGMSARAYEKYQQMARFEPSVVFIGRCGTYQYLDIHQVINQSLRGAATWLAGQ
jgi:UDP-galactopyranose mutase